MSIVQLSDWREPRPATGIGLPPPPGSVPDPAPVEPIPEPLAVGRSRSRDRLVLVTRGILMVLSALTLGFVIYVVWASRLEHQVTQSREFTQLRDELANGTAPRGPSDEHGQLLPLGTPIALLEIRSIGLKEVVDEGTTGSVLMAGPGHLRSTVFPGGVGTCVIYGRDASFGGPFSAIHSLVRGSRISVTTQVGTSTFRVVDVRKAGALVPSLAPGAARLTLVTATGGAFFPTGVIYVDANMVGPPFAARAPLRSVTASERAMAIDTGGYRGVALALEWLMLVLAAATWAWSRRGHAQAWIVFSAPVALAALYFVDQAGRLLPNLM
ncbi:MAG TPA: class E sortase [Acidimicrobiales bacterium]|nr:class E sortase [Acidimicrobiales bacterium]